MMTAVIAIVATRIDAKTSVIAHVHIVHMRCIEGVRRVGLFHSRLACGLEVCGRMEEIAMGQFFAPGSELARPLLHTI